MITIKVCVYAICKNEAKFVDRWVESMKEADEIYVLDTGSTDDTVEKLKNYDNVIVKQEIINPWRFDVARNLSLEMVPLDTDICVCTDLDEVFEKGWRKKVCAAWKKTTTQGYYNYNWALDKNGKPIVNFYIEKMHSRQNYKWTHPVHEVLTYTGNGTIERIEIPDITLNHYPDSSKSRSSYLPLLELSVEEDPNDDRNVHYLGREYMYYGHWNKAIDTLIKHLSLPSAVWKDERCASMRFIGRCYMNLKRYDEARMWFSKAIEEAPYLRDGYVELALLEYGLNNLEAVKDNCLKALEIKTHQKSYINEVFSWDYTIDDLLSIVYFYQNDFTKAYKHVEKALEKAKDDERIKENKRIIYQKLKEVQSL